MKDTLVIYRDAIRDGKAVIGEDGNSYFKLKLIRLNPDGFFDGVPISGHSWISLKGVTILPDYISDHL